MPVDNRTHRPQVSRPALGEPSVARSGTTPGTTSPTTNANAPGSTTGPGAVGSNAAHDAPRSRAPRTVPRSPTRTGAGRPISLREVPAKVAGASVPPRPAAALLASGYDVSHIPRDYDREGRISVPGAPDWSASLEGIAAKADGDLARAFTPLTLTPKSGKQPEPGVISVFIPGLNTPEPEASRRTQIYVDHLDTPMANMANGSRESLGDFDPLGFGPFKVEAGRRDWLSAGLTYLSLRTPPLSQKVADLLALNFAQAEPQKVRLSFYSDSTISMVQGLKLFTKQEVERRMDQLKAEGKNPRRRDVEAQVKQDLHDKVFIELHGNACYSLPEGPRYLVWTDKNDSLTFGKNPFAPQGKTGVSGKHPDPDYKDVVYIDYEGPFSDKGFNAHNLAANGIYTVAETLRRNGVENGEELYELAKSGRGLDIPQKGEVAGVAEELWD